MIQHEEPVAAKERSEGGITVGGTIGGTTPFSSVTIIGN